MLIFFDRTNFWNTEIVIFDIDMGEGEEQFIYHTEISKIMHFPTIFAHDCRFQDLPKPPPAINTTTTVSKERRSVLLQTATTTVQSSNGSRPVTAHILFDSGSQRSYITNSLKAKLGLVPVKSETVNLNTFGDKRFSKQLSDLVQVSLQGKNGFHSISALCFPKICFPSVHYDQYPPISPFARFRFG